jgi:hypothetical protein
MPTIIQQINLFSTIYQPLSTLTESNEQTNFAVHNLNKEKMKKRNLFMSTTIMCGLFVVAFTFKGDKITWLWADNKPLAIILGILAVVLGSQWIKYQRQLNCAKQN